MTLQKSRSEIMQICSQTKGVAFSLQGGGATEGRWAGERHMQAWQPPVGSCIGCVCVCVCVCCSVQFFATQWTVPGSSVHGIFQARILERVAISCSRGIFPTQGSNPHLCLLCWQTDSLPLSYLVRDLRLSLRGDHRHGFKDRGWRPELQPRQWRGKDEVMDVTQEMNLAGSCGWLALGTAVEGKEEGNLTSGFGDCEHVSTWGA